MQEEEKHIEIRNFLKNLPSVKASEDFDKNLFKKISEIDNTNTVLEIEKPQGVKDGIWNKLFGKNKNPWFVPALGFTIAAIFTIYITLQYKAGTEAGFNPGTDKKELPNIIDSAGIQKNTGIQNTPPILKQEDNVITEQDLNPQKSKLKRKEDYPEKTGQPELEAPSIESKATENSGIQPAEFENEIKQQEKTDETNINGDMRKSEIKSAPSFKKQDTEVSGPSENIERNKKSVKDSLNRIDSLSKINLEKLRDKIKENK